MKRGTDQVTHQLWVFRLLAFEQYFLTYLFWCNRPFPNFASQKAVVSSTWYFVSEIWLELSFCSMGRMEPHSLLSTASSRLTALETSGLKPQVFEPYNRSMISPYSGESLLCFPSAQRLAFLLEAPRWSLNCHSPRKEGDNMTELAYEVEKNPGFIWKGTKSGHPCKRT